MMNDKLKYSAWIEQYVDGDLNEVEMKEFESELASNKELEFEYNFDRDLVKAISDTDILDFRMVLAEMQSEVNKNKKQGARILQITRKYWYAAASVVLILAIAGSVFLFRPHEYSNEKLFEMYYTSGESVGISRSGNTNVVEALLQYQKGNYEEARVLFSELLEKDPGNAALTYYCGISNMETGKYNKAIELFSGILDNGNTLYVEYAQWYLGLAYLIDGENEKAIEMFKTIEADKSHYYRDEAVSILNKIEEGMKKNNFINKILFFVLPF